MSGLTVRQITQKIVVDAATNSVSVIATGPQGPAGPPGDFPITLSDTPPAGASGDDLWIRTTDFLLFVYYNDGNSFQWVEVGTINFADIDVDVLASQLVPYILNDPDFEAGAGGGGNTTPPTVTISTATHTLDLANKATLTMFDNASQVTVTIPSGVFEDGDWISLQALGAGGITFDTTGLTLLVDPIPDIPEGSGITIIFKADDTITFFGGASGGGGGTPVDVDPTKNTVAATGSTETLTLDDVQDVTMDADCTFTFPTPTVDVHVITLHLSGEFTPTWPGSVTWVGGYEPGYVSGNIYLFFTDDGGTTWHGTLFGGYPETQPFQLMYACSNEDDAIVNPGTKVTFRMPFYATLSEVRASLNQPCTTGTFTLHVEEEGVNVLSTNVTIDATEKSSLTAAIPAVISDADLADDAEMTIVVDNVGDATATGLKVTLIGTRQI